MGRHGSLLNVRFGVVICQCLTPNQQLTPIVGALEWGNLYPKDANALKVEAKHHSISTVVASITVSIFLHSLLCNVSST